MSRVDASADFDCFLFRDDGDDEKDTVMKIANFSPP